MRDDACFKILKNVLVTILKGNASEIARIAGEDVQTKGVDSSAVEKDLQTMASELARKRHCIVVITGQEDIVADEERIVLVKNGDPMMANVVGTSAPFYRWFTGGLVNTCFNALDRHVEGGRGEQAGLIYDSPVTETVRSYTYRELRDLTATCAGALADLGVGKGDRVIIYMPMAPEAVVAMLACARLGAVHSVVFGSFAANELAVRINDAEPKVIISASCGIEVKKVIEYKPLLDEAIRLARHKPERCLIFQRPMVRAALTPVMDVDWNEAMAKAELLPGRDITWAEAMGGARPRDCVPVSATDPLYILYTSGDHGAAQAYTYQVDM